MREVYIKMHVRDRTGPASKQHRIFFYKALHQVLGPCKIFCQFWCMIKNVKQKNPPPCRSLADHVDVFTKCFVIIGGVNGSVRIAFDIVIQWNFFVSN